MSKFGLISLLVLGPSLAMALTDGWTLPPRRIVSPDDAKAWFAPVGKGAEAFIVEKKAGAKGEVSFADGAIRIVKTNDKGVIRVMPREAVALPGIRRHRVSAEVESNAESPRTAKGFLRLGPRGKGGEIVFNSKVQGSVPHGLAQYDQLIVTPEGRPQLKATQWFREGPADTNELFAAICVGGTPSVSTWRNLRVDAVARVERANRADAHRGSGRNFTSDMVDDAVLDRTVAESADHVAKVVKRDGYACLTVDGETVPPILFKGGPATNEWNRFGGKSMHEAGVSLLVANIRFGSTDRVEGSWTTNGFDVVRAVRQVRGAMRTAPDALYVLTLRLDAPIGWCDTRTNEIWRTDKGEIVRGNACHAALARRNMTGTTWPWASNHSRVWRDDVKAVLSAFVAELKRTGLSKRIVGVHLGGYHDAQFATAVPDWSEPARRAFAASGESDYVRFIKRAPMEIQDDFARHVRAAFGKDIVVFRWCMAAFGGGFCSSHDIREFADSKEIDVIVPQPSYSCRAPGYAIGVKLPFSSLHLNGKLLMHELDLRTYASWPIADSAVRDAGLCRARDIDEWRTIDRKMAGQMIARRTGFWYFDMESGWFDPPEIAEDIASVIRTARPIYCGKPNPWRPTAALVIDESDLLGLQRGVGRNERASADLSLCIEHIAESGVPFDVYMKGDFDRGSLADRYRYVWRYDRRTKLKTGAELNAEARAAGAYVALPPGRVQVDMNGDFVSLHCIVPGRYDFRLPRPCEVVNLRSGKKESVRNGVLPLDLAPGETCWFALK